MKARTSLFIVAVFGLLALCGPVQAVENGDTIAYWKLDEGEGTTATDSAGDNNGIIYGAQWTTGQINGALSFDGVDDYVSLDSPANLDDLPLSNLTISAWIYDRQDNTWGTIFGSYVAGNGWAFRTFSNGNGDRSLYFDVPHTITNAVYHSNYGTVSQNTWHHVVAVWNEGTKTAKLYIDGIEPSYQTTTAGNGTYKSDASNNKEVGRLPHAGGIQYFNGTIDDVRIYDRALSGEEIQQLYLSGFSSHELAIIHIEDAIGEKEEALERIDAALEKEWAAYEALEELLESGDYGDLNKGDIVKAKQKILPAIQQEEQAIDALGKSIEKLKDALAALGVELEPVPIAYWKFDEHHGTTAYDSAGDNDGTIYGAQWTTGQVNGALSFDGVDDYVETAVLNLDNITLSAWIKVSREGIRQDIVSNHEVGGYGLFYREEGDLRWSVHLNGAYRGVLSNANIEQNRWYLVTATYDGDNGYLYVDGVKQAGSFGDNGTITDTGVPLTIGGNPLSGGGIDNAFDGKIDDVRIYDRPLSVEEIEQLYQDGLGKPGKGK